MLHAASGPGSQRTLIESRALRVVCPARLHSTDTDGYGTSDQAGGRAATSICPTHDWDVPSDFLSVQAVSALITFPKLRTEIKCKTMFYVIISRHLLAENK